MYLLDGNAIKRPNSMDEDNSTQAAQNRTLSGAINRDYFGSNKRTWILKYRNVQKADYDTINAIYQSYLGTGSTKSWEVTETNNTVSSILVHVDLQERSFTVAGGSYLSSFTLVLTEQ